MSYIGAQPTTAAFPYDQFSGNGSTTAFTMSYAPASTTSIVVSISGVVQNPNTYSVSGLTLTFSPAPPTGTNNIGVLFLGLPVTAVTTPGNTAYLSSTEFTATAGQTTFTPSGTYQVGFINVIRNGSQLAPSDYTATNGTTVVLANACVAGDVVVVEVYNLVSVSNALPLTGGTVTGATTFNSTVSINGANGSGYTGYKNRIINGNMIIDQRNNGALVASANGVYTVDRMVSYFSSGTVTAQQQSGGPVGFSKFLRYTVSSAGTRTAADYAIFQQTIEGNNIADLGEGSAGASTFTFSFWVRSSVAGLYSGCINSGDNNRGFGFTFTINSANTWEQKTATITGDTSGGTTAWPTGNIQGMYCRIDLGSGSNYQIASTGSWLVATNKGGVAGTVGWAQTAGATFDLTGVQLERGSNATSFEFRDYGRELMMCQRYLPAWNMTAVNQIFGQGQAIGTGTAIIYLPFKVSSRVAPTGITASAASNFYLTVPTYSVAGTYASTTFAYGSTEGIGLTSVTSTGLTAGNITTLGANTATAQILATGCEL